MGEGAMADGCSASSTAESPCSKLEMPPSHAFLGIPRPLNSPRRLPCKRPLELLLPALDQSSVSGDCSPVKQLKLEAKATRSLTRAASSEPGSPQQESLPVTPEARTSKVAEFTPDRPTRGPRGPRQNGTLDEAIEVATNLYKEALIAYSIERDVEAEFGDEKADKVCVQWAADHYEELKNAILGLLPWAGESKAAPSGKYDVITFHGVKTGAEPDVCEEQLQQLRAEGTHARAWEALCAVFAVVASREEKMWLQWAYTGGDLQQLSKKPQCKSRGSATRKAAIRKMVDEWMEDGAGAFVVSLVDPRSVHCVALARGPAGLFPATSMTTRRMPLWDALKTMDSGGPLRAAAARKEWCWGVGRQFAFQDLQFGHANGSRKERVLSKDLRADSQLRDLLRSQRPVILLDTLAALAPREVCKTGGVSEIVTAEMQMLLQEAKSQGVAVVWCVGSASPHKLAQRVYLRPPLADYGLRCGSLRWRKSAKAPWAREFKWDDRITLCLQMP